LPDVPAIVKETTMTRLVFSILTAILLAVPLSANAWTVKVRNPTGNCSPPFSK
jgi:hypothetical protein